MVMGAEKKAAKAAMQHKQEFSQEVMDIESLEDLELSQLVILGKSPDAALRTQKLEMKLL